MQPYLFRFHTQLPIPLDAVPTGGPHPMIAPNKRKQNNLWTLNA